MLFTRTGPAVVTIRSSEQGECFDKLARMQLCRRYSPADIHGHYVARQTGSTSMSLRYSLAAAQTRPSYAERIYKIHGASEYTASKSEGRSCQDLNGVGVVSHRTRLGRGYHTKLPATEGDDRDSPDPHFRNEEKTAPMLPWSLFHFPFSAVQIMV